MSLGYSVVIWVRNKYRVLFWSNGNNYQNTTFRQQFIFLSSFKFPQVPPPTTHPTPLFKKVSQQKAIATDISAGVWLKPTLAEEM